jgi:hypothetical protein
VTLGSEPSGQHVEERLGARSPVHRDGGRDLDDRSEDRRPIGEDVDDGGRVLRELANVIDELVRELQ